MSSRTFLMPVVRNDEDGTLWGHVRECNCASWGFDVAHLKERMTELVLDAHQFYTSKGSSFKASLSEDDLVESWTAMGAKLVCIEPLTVTFAA